MMEKKLQKAAALTGRLIKRHNFAIVTTGKTVEWGYICGSEMYNAWIKNGCRYTVNGTLLLTDNAVALDHEHGTIIYPSPFIGTIMGLKKGSKRRRHRLGMNVSTTFALKTAEER